MMYNTVKNRKDVRQPYKINNNTVGLVHDWWKKQLIGGKTTDRLLDELGKVLI